MARKLASIQVIHDVQPIPGADFIEMVRVLGWQLVSKKGEFSVGDECVFFEVDSLLPPSNPVFAFMEKAKYRVKTIKLRGQISQGLALPLDILPEWAREMETGFDCTDILGVIKYEPPQSTSRTGLSKGGFPGYVNKTDETRIQSMPKMLEDLKGQRMYYTIKVDGTSSTFSHLDGEINVCSRTRSIKEDDENAYWRMAKRHNILDILHKEGNIAIQGEIAGFWHKGRRSPIQKNRLGLDDTGLFVFDVFDIKEHRYYGFNEFIDFCSRYNLPTVPIGDVDFEFNHNIDDLLSLARGKYDSGHHREGIVVRTMEDVDLGKIKGRISFKVINNDFLLKVKE